MKPLPLLFIPLIALLPPKCRCRRKVSFNRDVRPILSENCYHCHGPDKTTRDGGRRLDVCEDALSEIDRVRAFVPGRPDESDAFVRIFSSDKDEQMPPRTAHKTLTAREKEVLKR